MALGRLQPWHRATAAAIQPESNGMAFMVGAAAGAAANPLFGERVEAPEN